MRGVCCRWARRLRASVDGDIRRLSRQIQLETNRTFLSRGAAPDKSILLQHTNGGSELGQGVGRDHAHVRVSARPAHQTGCRFRSITAALEPPDYAVADLHHAVNGWSLESANAHQMRFAPRQRQQDVPSPPTDLGRGFPQLIEGVEASVIVVEVGRPGGGYLD